MAPKSEALLLAEELRAAGATRETAGKRLQQAFPSMQKYRRSQLLTQYWGKVGAEASEPNDVPTAVETPKKTQVAFAAKLFEEGCSREEAKERLRYAYPDMGKSQRAQLLTKYWASPQGSHRTEPTPASSSKQATDSQGSALIAEPALKKRRLHVKQGDPHRERRGSATQEKEDFYKQEAIAMKPLLEELAIPRDGVCF